MLCISMKPGEYFTVGGSTVIQLDRLTGDRVHLTVNAPREVPILRGAARLRVHPTGPARAPAPMERREAGGPGGPAPDAGGNGGHPGGPCPAGEAGPHFSPTAGERRGVTDFGFDRLTSRLKYSPCAESPGHRGHIPRADGAIENCALVKGCSGAH